MSRNQREGKYYGRIGGRHYRRNPNNNLRVTYTGLQPGGNYYAHLKQDGLRIKSTITDGPVVDLTDPNWKVVHPSKDHK